MAMSIAGATSDALEIYAKRLSADQDFDPSASHRNFLIAATDIGHLLTLPWLEDWAQKTAQHVSFTAVPLGRARIVAELTGGEVAGRRRVDGRGELVGVYLGVGGFMKSKKLM